METSDYLSFFIVVYLFLMRELAVGHSPVFCGGVAVYKQVVSLLEGNTFYDIMPLFNEKSGNE